MKTANPNKKNKMRNTMQYSYKFTIIMALFILSCTAVKQHPYVFKKDDKKITLVLENNANHLRWNEKTTFTVQLEHIEKKRLSFSAPGLRFIQRSNDNQESILEIEPKREHIKGNTLKLFVNFRDEKDSVWVHTFKIPIK
jgi:hypothetical protein